MSFNSILDVFKEDESFHLCIGPDAILNKNSNKSLSQEFIELANDSLSEHFQIGTNIGLMEATSEWLRLAGEDNRDSTQKKIIEFWDSRNINNYPILNIVSHLQLNSVHYFGYDNLVYKAISLRQRNALNYSIDTKVVFSEGSKKDLSTLKILVRDVLDSTKTIRKYSDLQAHPKHKITFPVFNWFGNLNGINNSESIHYGAERLNKFLTNIVLAAHPTKNSSLLKKIFSDIGQADFYILGSGLADLYNSLIIYQLKSSPFAPFSRCMSVNDEQNFDSRRSSRFTKKLFNYTAALEENYSAVGDIINGHSNFIRQRLDVEDKRLVEKLYKGKRKRVFISYATEDLETARKVADACYEAGVVPYVAHDDRFVSYEHWLENCEPYIDVEQNSCGCILLISEDYRENLLKKKWNAIKEEVGQAAGHYKNATNSKSLVYPVIAWSINKVIDSSREDIQEKIPEFTYKNGLTSKSIGTNDQELNETVTTWIRKRFREKE